MSISLLVVERIFNLFSDLHFQPVSKFEYPGIIKLLSIFKTLEIE